MTGVKPKAYIFSNDFLRMIKEVKRLSLEYGILYKHYDNILSNNQVDDNKIYNIYIQMEDLRTKIYETKIAEVINNKVYIKYPIDLLILDENGNE